MKELGKIILYLIATVVLGTLLAAPLYWGGHWLAGHGILKFLGETEFRKYFDRALLVAAIALLWPTAKWIKVPDVRALGLEKNSQYWRDVSVGFAASFILMLALALVLVGLHIAKWRNFVPWGDLGSAAISAAFVPFLEEWLFRGAIMGLLLRAMSVRGALFATSALYSILHFLKQADDAPSVETVHWFSGFTLIPGAFNQFSEPWLVLGGFTTLFCIGWILGWARLKTHSLAMPMGLHAGWIFGYKAFSNLSRRVVKDTLPWVGEDLKVGLCSVFIVLITGGLIWAYITYVRKTPQHG